MYCPVSYDDIVTISENPILDNIVGEKDRILNQDLYPYEVVRDLRIRYPNIRDKDAYNAILYKLERDKGTLDKKYYKDLYRIVTEKEYKKTVKEVENILEKSNIENVDVKVIPTEEYLPDNLRHRFSNPSALYDPHNETVYILSTKDNIKESLFHELVVHHGLRKLLGDDFNNFLTSVKNKYGNDSSYKTVENKYNLSYINYRDRDLLIAEEFIAEYAENRGFDLYKEDNLLKSIFNTVKKLVKNIFSFTYKDEDLDILLKRSLFALRKGSSPYASLSSSIAGSDILDKRSVELTENAFTTLDTASPHFRNWWNNGKLVDDNGNPRVLYSRRGKNFNEYSEDIGEVQVVLNLKKIANFKNIDNIEASIDESESIFVSKGRKDLWDSLNNIDKSNISKGKILDTLVSYLKEVGYDGIKSGNSYIAFENESVKVYNSDFQSFTMSEYDFRYDYERARSKLPKQIIDDIIFRVNRGLPLIGISDTNEQDVIDFANKYSFASSLSYSYNEDLLPYKNFIEASSMPLPLMRLNSIKKVKKRNTAFFKDQTMAPITSAVRRLELFSDRVASESTKAYINDLLGKIGGRYKRLVEHGVGINFNVETKRQMRLFTKSLRDIQKDFRKRIPISQRSRMKKRLSYLLTLDNVDPNTLTEEELLIYETYQDLRKFSDGLFDYAVSRGSIRESSRIEGYYPRNYNWNLFKDGNKKRKFRNHFIESFLRYTDYNKISNTLDDLSGEKLEEAKDSLDFLELQAEKLFDSFEELAFRKQGLKPILTEEGIIYEYQKPTLKSREIIATTFRNRRVPKQFKNRPFFFLDDSLMVQDFSRDGEGLGAINNDPFESLGEQIAKTVVDAEYNRIFGNNGSVFTNVANKINNDPEIESRDKAHLVKLLGMVSQMLTGYVDTSINPRISDSFNAKEAWLRTIFNLGFLSKATLWQNVETANLFVLYNAGILKLYGGAIANYLTNTFRDNPKGLVRIWKDFALGYEHDDNYTTILAGDFDINKMSGKVNNWFFKAGLLTQSYKLTKFFAVQGSRIELHKFSKKPYERLKEKDKRLLKSRGIRNENDFKSLVSGFFKQESGFDLNEKSREFELLSRYYTQSIKQGVAEVDVSNRSIASKSLNPFYRNTSHLMSFPIAYHENLLSFVWTRTWDDKEFSKLFKLLLNVLFVAPFVYGMGIALQRLFLGDERAAWQEEALEEDMANVIEVITEGEVSGEHLKSFLNHLSKSGVTSRFDRATRFLDFSPWQMQRKELSAQLYSPTAAVASDGIDAFTNGMMNDNWEEFSRWTGRVGPKTFYTGDKLLEIYENLGLALGETITEIKE